MDLTAKYYYCYVTTNTINGKKYVGKHYGHLDDDYIGSGKVLKSAIKKHGAKAFHKEIICIVKDPVDLDVAEKMYIEKFDAVASDSFYNLAEGGSGGNTLTNDKIIQKRTAKFRQYWNALSPEEISRISELRSKNAAVIRKNQQLENKRIKTFKETVAKRSASQSKALYASRSGANHYCARKVLTPKGVFTCAKDAAIEFGVHIQTVLNRCKNKNLIEWEFLDVT